MACRKHRIDLNVLVEHDQEAFMADISKFVDQLPEVDHINLFLTSLRWAWLGLHTFLRDNLTLYRQSINKTSSDPFGVVWLCPPRVRKARLREVYQLDSNSVHHAEARSVRGGTLCVIKTKRFVEFPAHSDMHDSQWEVQNYTLKSSRTPSSTSFSLWMQTVCSTLHWECTTSR